MSKPLPYPLGRKFITTWKEHEKGTIISYKSYTWNGQRGRIYRVTYDRCHKEGCAVKHDIMDYNIKKIVRTLQDRLDEIKNC